MMLFRLSAAAIILGMSAARAGDTAHAGHPFTRDEARKIILDVQKIVSPDGIDTLTAIPVNGTQQWISVRGRDKHNPILLFIHGGPAAPELPMRWTFQSPWEDYFTVVQWDQRGSGKTYNANDPAKIRPTLTLPQMYADTETVVNYLRTTYHTDKIFVLGHSWGSVLGLMLAQKRPDWLYAYIGMGQLINSQENERVGYEAAMKQAEAAGNADAIKELRAIAPYPEANGALPINKVLIERKWSSFFGDLAYNRTSYDFFSNAGALSPDYTDDDVAAADKSEALTLPQLAPGLSAVDFEHVTRFGCPIVIFAGRHDETVSSEIVANWFQRIEAPSKKFVWFDNSAHEIEIEEPGRMLVHLVQDVLPYAQTAHQGVLSESLR